MFGVDPEIGVGFKEEEQKGILGRGWRKQTCGDGMNAALSGPGRLFPGSTGRF